MTAEKGREKAEDWLRVLGDFADELPASEEEAFWRAFSKGINKRFYDRWGEAKAKRKAAQREAAERERQERLELLRNGPWHLALSQAAEAYVRDALDVRERNRFLMERIRRQGIQQRESHAMDAAITASPGPGPITWREFLNEAIANGNSPFRPNSASTSATPDTAGTPSAPAGSSASSPAD